MGVNEKRRSRIIFSKLHRKSIQINAITCNRNKLGVNTLVTSPAPPPKLPHLNKKYTTKYSLSQCISLTITSLFLFICLVTIIGGYFVQVPDMTLIYSTILDNPADALDLTQFPNIYYKSKIGIKVVNNNILPFPIVGKFEGYFGDSNEVFAIGQVNGILIKPMTKTLLELVLVSKVNILEPKLKNLVSLGDICGLIQGNGRTVMNGRIVSTMSIGWNGIGIPLKTVNLKNTTFACPLNESNNSEIVLRLADLLIPYVELLSGVWNAEEMKDRAEHFRF
ncbi:hypothetical protein CONCODRAFT_69137 [Conidiobolus coronatus NRRL 28638]|uniref:Uncharacterized protein n=1 Tax=Conidiobolus coronatus (strain ATCC 28846 / CBS 209.66 / NRRL 28638) TaxID=796925 RepID=A0A137PBI3_CONC2|nr:hypothetical protein CONCODRAFT_69137 [Conidiobolus coronatus NRRL 28638]|eukprot:KXN72354.1 hypothetical protein CONCODRAFT_69137 [Conidiobolus coronatus NRRL 28638]